MKKRLIVVLAIGAVSIFIFALLAYASFSDVQDHKYQVAINFIQSRGIVKGYPDGTFRPNSKINRAELLTIIVGQKYQNLSSKNCFSDIFSNQWYAKFVCKGKELGIVTGYPDGSFKPAQSVNFVEALIMLQRAHNIPVNTSILPWFKNSVDSASGMNIIPFDIDSFDEKITRGQMAEMITRFIKHNEKSLDEYLGSKKDFVVTYNNIKNHVNVESFWTTSNLVPRLVHHAESGIYNKVSFNDPKTYWLKAGDTLPLSNNLILEINTLISNSNYSDGINSFLYYDTIPRIYYPEPAVFLREERNFSLLPFFSRDNVYIALGDQRQIDGVNQREIKVYSNPRDLFQHCLEEGYEEVLCLTEIARYGVVHESYDEIFSGRFKVVFPKALREFAEQTLEYLPGCYNHIRDIFGHDQNINNFSVFFYYPEESEERGEAAFAKSDSIIVPFFGYRNDSLNLDHPNEPCGVTFFPMGHEMTHVFDFGTYSTPLLREGFANYVSRRVNTFDSQLICEENGYRVRWLDADAYGTFTPYDIEKDAYNVGECYFNRLENNYGISKVNDLIESLGTTRNHGVDEVNFFTDVVSPIFGENALKMAENMGIDTTCHYDIPFLGYNCDSIEE